MGIKPQFLFSTAWGCSLTAFRLTLVTECCVKAFHLLWQLASVLNLSVDSRVTSARLCHCPQFTVCPFGSAQIGLIKICLFSLTFLLHVCLCASKYKMRVQTGPSHLWCNPGLSVVLRGECVQLCGSGFCLHQVSVANTCAVCLWPAFALLGVTANDNLQCCSCKINQLVLAYCWATVTRWLTFTSRINLEKTMDKYVWTTEHTPHWLWLWSRIHYILHLCVCVVLNLSHMNSNISRSDEIFWFKMTV